MQHHLVCLQLINIHLMTLKTVLLVGLLTSFSFRIHAQTADEIINQCVRYTGGAAAWKKIQTLVSEGTYNYGGLEFPFKSYSKRPYQYKYIVPFKGKYFAQAYDGKQGWKIDAFNGETKKTRLTGKAALAMANEADPELESPLINYKTKGHRAVLEGSDTVQGITCYKLKLTRKNGEEETLFFSNQDYSLLKKRAVSKNAELKNSLLDTYYSDYQEVHGVKIPFTTLSRDNDQVILTIKIKKADVNVPVADAEFAF